MANKINLFIKSEAFLRSALKCGQQKLFDLFVRCCWRKNLCLLVDLWGVYCVKTTFTNRVWTCNTCIGFIECTAFIVGSQKLPLSLCGTSLKLKSHTSLATREENSRCMQRCLGFLRDLQGGQKKIRCIFVGNLSRFFYCCSQQKKLQ